MTEADGLKVTAFKPESASVLTERYADHLTVALRFSVGTSEYLVLGEDLRRVLSREDCQKLAHYLLAGTTKPEN